MGFMGLIVKTDHKVTKIEMQAASYKFRNQKSEIRSKNEKATSREAYGV
jgi:hypothetical protein